MAAKYDVRFTNVKFSELKQIEALKNTFVNNSAITINYDGNLEYGSVEITVANPYSKMRRKFLKEVIKIIKY